MNSDINENVFAYCFGRIVEKAEESAEIDDGSEFFDGKRLAYFEAIEAVQNAIMGFGIDLKEVGMDYDANQVYVLARQKQDKKQ